VFDVPYPLLIVVYTTGMPQLKIITDQWSCCNSYIDKSLYSVFRAIDFHVIKFCYLV